MLHYIKQIRHEVVDYENNENALSSFILCLICVREFAFCLWELEHLQTIQPEGLSTGLCQSLVDGNGGPERDARQCARSGCDRCDQWSHMMTRVVQSPFELSEFTTLWLMMWNTDWRHTVCASVRGFFNCLNAVRNVETVMIVNCVNVKGIRGTSTIYIQHKVKAWSLVT